MKIENLKYFIKTAQIGNINKAADELFLTHQNLSFIIKKMEMELGVTLFIRSKNGVTLTSDGHDFLAVAQLIVGSYENFLRAKLSRDMNPILEIYTTPTLATYLSNVQEYAVADGYFVSIHRRNIEEMVALLENNQQGIFLIPIYNNYPKIAVDYKEKFVLLKDYSITIAHKNNPLTKKATLSQQEIDSIRLITNSYYLNNPKNRISINIDNLSLVKKTMRENQFCYNTTHWVYDTFFGQDEWIILDNVDLNSGEIIEYTLLINLTQYMNSIAINYLMPILQDVFLRKK